MNVLFAVDVIDRFLTSKDGSQQESDDQFRAGLFTLSIVRASRSQDRENRHTYAHAEVQVW